VPNVDMVPSVGKGVMEMAISSMSYAAGLMPEYLYSRAPMAARNADDLRTIWAKTKNLYRESYAKQNVRILTLIQCTDSHAILTKPVHVLVTDGCFYGKGMFRVAHPLDMKKLESIFRHKVFKMLLAKGRITQDLIAMLSNWRHSGFQVFCGPRIYPRDETAMENLARYILRASFSQERMQYLAEPSKVVYRAKDGTGEKIFDAPVSSTGQALEWLTAMCSHIPDRGEQMVRYFGIMDTTVMFPGGKTCLGSGLAILHFMA